jgi:putative PIN family toxin of toxin-antitoxin system
MRVVLDTNVLVSAFLFGGTPLELVSLAESSVFELVTSEEALAELADVLHRPAFRRRFHTLGFTPLDVVERYRELATLSELGASPGICEDPDDDRFVALAMASEADVIVSGDQHLLACSDASPVPVVTPAQLLAIIKQALGQSFFKKNG